MITRQTLQRLIVSSCLIVIVALLFDGSVTSPASAAKNPTAPTNLTVTGVTETTISLVWGPSTHTRRFSYQVNIINHNNSAYNTYVTVSQSQTSYTWRFLPPNSNFSITVFAIDDRGHRSANSNTVNVATLADTTPPSTPTLQTTVLGPSQVMLTWTQSTDNLPLNCCTYRFVMNGAPLTQHINWAAAPAGQNAVIIRRLTPSTTYTFNVKVTDYQGNTATSNPSSSTTDASSDTTPPSVPTNLHLVQYNGALEVWLGWDKATDDVDAQDEIEYEIYVNGVLSSLQVTTANVEFVYATIFGDNEFVVKAVDRSGNSSAASVPLTLFLQ